MGGRQSKRSGSVDITGTPKKGEVENGAAVEGGRMERIEESDLLPGKLAANGTTPHVETQLESSSLPNGETTESPEKKLESEPEEPKTPDTPATTEAAEPETPDDQSTEEATAASTPATEPETKQETGSPDKTKDNEKSDKKKNKEKSKKKWSFRSISFSKKDKSKPTNVSREESKNGNLTEQAGGILQEVSESVEQAVEQTSEHAAAVTAAVAEEAEKKAEETVKDVEETAKETVKDIEETVNKVVKKIETQKEELMEQVVAVAEEQKGEIVKEETVIASTVSSVLSTVSSTVESTTSTVVESIPSVASSAVDDKKLVIETPTAAAIEEVKPAPIDDTPLVAEEQQITTELITETTSSPVKTEPSLEESETPVPEPTPISEPKLVPAKVSEPVVVTEVVQPEPVFDEVPPPLPASPPPTEAPPPTPVQPVPEVPAPELDQTPVAVPVVNDIVKEDISVCDEVGGGGESMAELGIEDSEVIPPPVDLDDKVSIPDLPPPPPMVNGISNDDAAHKVNVDNVVEKIEVKTLPLDNTEVSDAIVSTVTHTTNSIEE